MSKPKTRGISLVRSIDISEPNRKEKLLAKREFEVRINAAIPFTHKAFQNQHLPENYEDPKPPVPQAKKKPKNNPGRDKLQKHKNNYAG